MKNAATAPTVEVVSEGPPSRTLAEILKNPPTLELAGAPRVRVQGRDTKPPKDTGRPTK
jgi:hypothetical protein